MRARILLGVLLPLGLTAPSIARAVSPQEIVAKMLVHDHWGLSGAEVSAVATLTDKRGATKTLAFNAESRKWQKDLTKSMVRFTSPPDIAGAGFLQTQNDDRDDDRFLYLPALKRARRIASSQRSSAFMGTDYNFADLDRRDTRSGTPSLGPDTNIGKFPCFHLVITPTRKDSPYSRIEIDVRKTDFVPLQVKSFDKAGVHLKTLTVQQVKRVSGQWFITKSKMENHKESHSTTLQLQKVKPRSDIPDDRFTQANLEK